MGAKFANLQVHNGDIDAVKGLCPASYTVSSLSAGWITVTGSGIGWGTAQKEARRISKDLGCSILSIEYFDDDFVELAVYKADKKVAGHIPASYEGFQRIIGKPKKFADALQLQPDDEKLLKTVFQEEAPEICVHLMESLLGCVLWVDEESLNSAKPLGRDYLDQYLSNKAVNAKIKNQTKLVLMDELTGDFDSGLTYPVVRQENHQMNEKTVWSISADGHWKRDFSTDVPGRVEVHRAYCRSETKTVLTFGLWGTQGISMKMCCYTNDGDIKSIIACNDLGALHASFLTESLLFREGTCHDIENGSVLWDLGLGRTAYGIKAPQRVSADRYAFVYDTMFGDESGYLAIFNLDGIITHSIKLPVARHWAYPMVAGEKIYMYYSMNNESSVFACFDLELNEEWHVDISGTEQLGKPVFDIKKQIVYFHASYDCIVAVGLTERQLLVSRRIPSSEYASLIDIFPGDGPIVQTGDSTIEVWNSELVTISKHRAKGGIMEVIHQNGHCHITTIKEDQTSSSFDHSVARVYALKSVNRK